MDIYAAKNPKKIKIMTSYLEEGKTSLTFNDRLCSNLFELELKELINEN